MIRDNRRFDTVACVGGLDLESPPLRIPDGSLILCQNFDVKAGGGYRRIGGFERFDGRESPSVAADPSAARAAISQVPGSGQILGVHYYGGALYAVRNHTDNLSAKLFKSSGAGWTHVQDFAVPNGSFEFITHNFYGASKGERMYGVDGSNNAFMYDGTTFTWLIPPGQTDKPTHIAAHKNHLFLGYPNGQYLHSGIGEPTAWDVATEGAGAGGTGDEIVAIRPTVGGALAFFMRNKVSLLYGSSKADWQAADLRNQSDKSGAIEHTVQDMGDLFYVDDRGITTMQQTQAFGNFLTSTIDRPVKRFVQSRKQLICGSCISRDRSQYMLFLRHSEGTEVLSLTIGSNGIDGYARAVYPFTTLSGKMALTSQEDENGNERIFVGADDGYVYELEKGTSFDGGDIEAYLKLAFSHLGSPNQNKYFRSMIMGLEADTNLSLQLKPEFDYGSREHAGHRIIDASITGGGGAFDNTNWNEFNWSAQVVSDAKVDIGGNGRNLAILVYHNSASDSPFTIYDATIQYSVRGLRR